MSNSERTYPADASIRLAASGNAEAYYFKTPTGGVMQVPAMNAEQARQLAADEYRGFGSEDFEQVDRDMHDADDRYSIAVFIEGKQYVATQDEATIEARGFSAAEAIANFALAVEAKNNGEQVVADE